MANWNWTKQKPEPSPFGQASNACVGKDKLSEAVARQRARALTLQLKETMNYYQCDACGKWHVGHAR